MAKAEVVTAAGTKIVIEGTVEEVKEIINSVKSIENTQQKRIEKNENNKVGKANNATNTIQLLRENGFFNKPKSLIEIKKALDEQGMIYPVTTLSGILLKLVRKRIIGRVDVNKKWCYVKRGE